MELKVLPPPHYVRTYVCIMWVLKLVVVRIAFREFSFWFVSRVAIIVGPLLLSGACKIAWKNTNQRSHVWSV